MVGKVYMMLCERARTAGIEEGWAGLVDRERSQTTASSRTKSNGMPDIRRPVGRIPVQNVLNEQISSFLYVIWASKRTKKAEMIQF